MDLPNHFGYTTFCDDIRREVGGKVSFIGGYGNAIYLHGAFPFTLPKFGFGITYFQRNKVFTGDLTFHIFMPGDAPDAPSVSVQMEIAQLRAIPIPLKSHDTWPDAEFVRLDHQIVAAPLIIQQTGTIKVRAIADGDTAKLGILRVGQKLPEADAPPESVQTDEAPA